MEGDTCYDNDAGRHYAVRVEVRLCTRSGSALRSRGEAPREPTATPRGSTGSIVETPSHEPVCTPNWPRVERRLPPGLKSWQRHYGGNECPAERDVRAKLGV